MFKVYTAAAYTDTVHTFTISERMHSQEDPVPDPDPLNGEDSGSDDGSGSSGDSGGNTSEENQLFIENLYICRIGTYPECHFSFYIIIVVSKSKGTYNTLSRLIVQIRHGWITLCT